MKIALIAEMEAAIVLPTTVTTKYHPYEFEVFKEEGKLWLKVTKPVKEYEAFLPKVSMINGTVNIVIWKDDIYRDLLEWLQYIEAMGSFNFGVERVFWDRPIVCWLPENDDERRQVPMPRYKRTPQEGARKKLLKDNNLFDVVVYRRQLKDLYIPFTYYKEGQRFFHNVNYYFAFINFFMLLEYCFAKGKFKSAEVIKQFKESKILKLSILQLLAMPSMHSGDAIWDWLERECNHYNKQMNVEGIIYLLVSLRGELFHASSKSEKRYRDDTELRPLVVAISTICFMVCGHLQIFGFTGEKQKENVLDTMIAQFSSPIQI